MRVAVLGLGEAGAGIHLPALQKLAAVELVGGVDVDPQRRETVSNRWRVPVYADLGGLFAASRPELVIVASPPAFHLEHCLAALDAGAHVLCEKPFASSVGEGTRILERAAAVGRQVAVNHEFRAMPVFRGLLDAVSAHGPGAPVMAQAWQLIDANPGQEAGWRGQLRHRTLYEAGVHLVDLMLAIFGEVPSGVRATMAAADPGASAIDATTVVTLRFSRDRLAEIIQSRRHRGDRQYLEMRLDTCEASYRASFGGRARLRAGLERSPRPSIRLEWGASGIAWRESGPRRVVLARNPPTPLIAGTRTVIEACVRAIRAGQPVPFPAEDGLNCLRVIAAAYLASSAGREVSTEGEDAAAAASLLLGSESP